MTNPLTRAAPRVTSDAVPRLPVLALTLFACLSIAHLSVAQAADPASVKPATFNAVAHGPNGPLPSAQGKLNTQVMADGLSQPWGFDFLPDGRVIVSEKSGRMQILSPAAAGSQPAMQAGASLTGVPEVADRGQGGLLDVALSPTFADDNTLYFTFAEPADGGSRTSVAKATLSETGLKDVRILFNQTPALRSARHFGSRIIVAPDGTLLVGLGDRGQESYAQKLDNTIGKVVRLAPSGNTALTDNPLSAQDGTDPFIYSYGHRNIQGAFLHPDTQRLWVVDHGPQGGDEISEVEPGGNHGWPRITRGVQYGSATKIGDGVAAPGIVEAKVWWTPVSIAPSGLVYYTDDKVASLRNHVLAGSLTARALIALQMADGAFVSETRYVTDEQERIRQIRVGPDGHPWVLTVEGRLLRVVSP